ncbi:MAG: 23S rRNA (adenine(2503)-C(2))-methyltransferase RlmN [Clostridiales bacterium]|nr:23S rRNA (adenine(2503)-C(2))-methyltransferase RlmN [Clostridiales bacterium]
MDERQEEKKDIRSMTLEELTKDMEKMGEKAFRAKQVYQWLHEKLVEQFEDMTNLSKPLREKLMENYRIPRMTILSVLTSENNDTKKYLFQLEDGNVIESVWMRYHHGNSVCISSQVGCRMGCRFCASTLLGLERNLFASEMLGQIYAIQNETKERVSNIVVMGTGEPLDNYENLLRFIHLISREPGLHISQRNITVSTCGIVEKIRELAKEKLQITLAVSLHAPNTEKRRELMPVANRYGVEELLAACKDYFSETGRRITFEYSLVAGVNDNREEALELASLLKGFPCHVNLIPVNPIKERSYTHSGRKEIEAFKLILEKYHINVTIRREMGADINAACGQLRKSYMDQKQ